MFKCLAINCPMSSPILPAKSVHSVHCYRTVLHSSEAIGTLSCICMVEMLLVGQPDAYTQAHYKVIQFTCLF